MVLCVVVVVVFSDRLAHIKGYLVTPDPHHALTHSLTRAHAHTHAHKQREREREMKKNIIVNVGLVGDAHM